MKSFKLNEISLSHENITITSKNSVTILNDKAMLCYYHNGAYFGDGDHDEIQKFIELAATKYFPKKYNYHKYSKEQVLLAVSKHKKKKRR